MMEIILYLYRKCRSLITMGMPISVLREENIFEKIISVKYDIANDEMYKFDEYEKDIDAFYNRVMEKNA